VPRSLALFLTATALLWSVLILASPAWLARGGGPTLLAGTVYASASRFCHQQSERSFYRGGVQLPVCGRCTGLYFSGAFGAVIAWLPFRRRPRGRDRYLLMACAVPTGLTWGMEVAGLASFSNELRALAALPLGACAGWFFVGTLRDEARVVPPPCQAI